MSDVLIRVSYKGRRERITLQDPTFVALEDEVKRLFNLEDVDLVAKYKDKTEHDICDDYDFQRHLNNELNKIIVSEYLKEPLEIVLGRERHTLDMVPLSDSVLVKYAKIVVIPEFNLPKFVYHLGKTADFIRMTYYRLLACGEYASANIVEKLAGKVLKPLMENCKVTFDLFVTITRDMLDQYRRIFEFSRDGVDLHERAAHTSKCLEKKAVELKTESAKMVDELSEAVFKVSEVVAAVACKMAEQGKGEQECNLTLKRTNKLIAQFERSNDECNTAKKSEEEARNAYLELENRHSGLYWFYAWILGAKSFKQKENLRVRMEKAKREYEDACEEVRRAKKEKPKIETRKEEATQRQQELSNVFYVLTEASKSIKHALIIVINMETFWRKMKGAGKSLAEDTSFLENTKMASGDDGKAKRLRHSMGYKRQALSYCARIVAIRDISIDCSQELTQVGGAIDAVLVDTPTREEARANVDEIGTPRETPSSSPSLPRRDNYSVENDDKDTVNQVAVMFGMPFPHHHHHHHH